MRRARRLSLSWPGSLWCHIRGAAPAAHGAAGDRLDHPSPVTLAEEDRAGLARCPELDTATGHVRDFGEILTDRLGSTRPTWRGGRCS